MEAKDIIVFKYGGNAMVNESLKKDILNGIGQLKKSGLNVVIVHGGGPFIQEELNEAGIESEFIEGHRRTTPDAMVYVEKVLKGKVNAQLVTLMNTMGFNTVGLSGKDGNLVIAEKRWHLKNNEKVDLGQVGDVRKVNTDLIDTLLNNEMIPIITCVAADEDGNTYNINADMFAGSIAGALKARQFIVLTDIDGLRMDKDDPETLIKELAVDRIPELKKSGVIAGGMIPKLDACQVALEKGTEAAQIMNGTKPELLKGILKQQIIGTKIIR